MNVFASKAEIREVMRKRRATLDPLWSLAASRRVAERITCLPEFQRAEVICCYLTLPGEVDTQSILDAAWKAGKKVSVPAARDDGEYYPAWLTPMDSVTAGRFKVKQPTVPFWSKPDRFDVVVIPGVAFSETGTRLGHGAGFYDRMLARLGPRVECKVGVCFSFQLHPALPFAEHDVGMDVVVTEEKVYRTR